MQCMWRLSLLSSRLLHFHHKFFTVSNSTKHHWSTSWVNSPEGCNEEGPSPSADSCLPWRNSSRSSVDSDKCQFFCHPRCPPSAFLTSASANKAFNQSTRKKLTQHFIYAIHCGHLMPLGASESHDLLCPAPLKWRKPAQVMMTAMIKALIPWAVKRACKDCPKSLLHGKLCIDKATDKKNDCHLPFLSPLALSKIMNNAAVMSNHS